MNKNTLYGFIFGGAIASVVVVFLISSPSEVLEKFSAIGKPPDVDRSLNTTMLLERKLAQLELDLANERVKHQDNDKKYEATTEKLRKEIKKLTSSTRSGSKDLNALMVQMEKEINFLSNKLHVPPKNGQSIDDLKEQRASFRREISTLTLLLAETEQQLADATRLATEAKELKSKQQAEIDAQFERTQIEEQVSSNVAVFTKADGLYDTSLLLGERKLFRNQAQIYYGGKLSIDLKRIDVGNYCDVRIRSFIDESESTTVNIRKGEPAKVRMAEEDFIIHYFYSYDRPIPTCVFNVYEM